ncbi:MAG TPA: hypothetical protein VFW95_08000 [Candidatus Limnocylindria bacterium]|nr:hypothetical protein [Candidatus Limnocylindria bacterium]
MPTAYIVIFMLFFAVLAAGWFYWQRAKTRDAVKATDVVAAAPAAEAPATDTPAPSDVAQQ